MRCSRSFINPALLWLPLFVLVASTDLHNQASADETAQAANSANEQAAEGKPELPNGLVLRHVLKGHDTDVRCLAFSPDGKTLASGSYGQPSQSGGYVGYVKFWDVESGKETKSLGAHGNSVLGLAYTSDGKQLVTGGADEKIRLWNVEDYKYVKAFSGHTDAVYGVAVSPSGKSIASASYDGTVRVWEIESGKERFNLDAHTDDVTAVAFSPDSRSLASVSHDKTVRLWGAKPGTLQGHEWWVVSARFSPDGKLLATGSWDDTVILWDVARQEKVAVLEVDTSQGAYVAFTPDGRTLITAGPKLGTSGIVKIWDVVSGQVRGTINPGDGLIWAIDVSQDGKYLATGSGKMIKLWELKKQRPEDLPPLAIDERKLFGFSGDSLEIKNDYLTPQGGIHPDLIKAVKDRDGLTRISVMNTRIADVGFAQLANLPWVDRVESLLMGDTKLTDASLKELSKFRSLAELNLNECEKLTNDGLAALQGLESLTVLRMSGTSITDPGLAHIGQLTNLEGLAIGYGEFTDEGMPHLAALKRLRWLDLQKSRITDNGLESLGGLSSLKSLDLSDGVFENERKSNITGSGLRHLGTLKTLEALDLDYTKVGDEGLAHLAPLSRLESLSLSHTRISDAGAEQFAQLKRLDSLDLKATKVGDEAMKQLAGLERLRVLTIEETPVTDAGLEYLVKLESLRSLWLEDAKVTYEGVKRLRKALPELDVEGAPRATLQEHLVEIDPSVELDFSEGYRQVYAVAFSPDGKILAAAGETGFGEDQQGSVKLWDAQSNKEVDAFSLGKAIHHLSFSSDGKLLLVSGEDEDGGKVWFRDVAGKRVTHTLEHGHSVRRAKLLPDGKTCCTASLQGAPPLTNSDVKLWNWQTGEEVAAFENASQESAVSPNGETLATTGAFGASIELLDLKTKEKVATLEYRKDGDILEADPSIIGIAPLVFSDDGKRLALGIHDWGDDAGYAPVKTWNVPTKEKGPTLKQYGALRKVVFSPDGRLVATCGSITNDFATPRGRIKVFDVARGVERCTIDIPRDVIHCVAFSPDGKQLAATGTQQVRVWDVQKLLSAAKE